MPPARKPLRRVGPTLLCALVVAPVVLPRDRLRVGGGGGGYEETGACEETQFRKYATAAAIYERDFFAGHTLRLQLQYFHETGDDLPRAAWGLISAADWRIRGRYVGLSAGMGIGGIRRQESPPPISEGKSSKGGPTADGNEIWPVPRLHLEVGPRWLHGYGALNPGLTAMALLMLNDHWWKGAWPGSATGKLSDLCGLVFFPVLVGTVGLPPTAAVASPMLSQRCGGNSIMGFATHSHTRRATYDSATNDAAILSPTSTFDAHRAPTNTMQPTHSPTTPIGQQ